MFHLNFLNNLSVQVQTTYKYVNGKCDEALVINNYIFCTFFVDIILKFHLHELLLFSEVLSNFWTFPSRETAFHIPLRHSHVIGNCNNLILTLLTVFNIQELRVTVLYFKKFLEDKCGLVAGIIKQTIIYYDYCIECIQIGLII